MNRLELFVYFSVYILYIVYSLISILSVRREILKLPNADFAKGWKLLGGVPRDHWNTDLENYNMFMKTIWPWIVAHYLVIQYVRLHYRSRQGLLSSLTCLLALTYVLGLVPILIVMMVLVSYYPARKWDSKITIWMISLLWMTLLNYVKFQPEMNELFESWKYYIWISTCGWTILRCTSFSMDYVDSLKSNGVESGFNYESYLGYCLHLPTATFGPFMTYSRYAQCLKTDSNIDLKQNVRERNKLFFFELIRCGLIWFLMMTLQHFLYISYMSYDLKALSLIKSSFGKYGAGYFMGIFFYLFYRMAYGMGNAFARLDGMNPPANPICIARVHYYSDMWRQFDSGLYEFLFHYIYLNVRKLGSPKNRWSKVLGMIITYTFVYIWHGCYSDVFIWAFLNMGIIMIEKIYHLSFNSLQYNQWKCSKNLWFQAVLKRLEAIVGSHIFIIAAFSNLYFIGNFNVGNLMMKTLFTQTFINYSLLVFYSYCLFQCSEFIRLKKNEKSLTKTNLTK